MMASMTDPSPISPIINAFWRGGAVVLVRRDASGKRVLEQRPAEHCIILGGDTPEPLLRSLRASRYCIGAVREPGGWWRTRWRYDRSDPGAAPVHVRVAKRLEEEHHVRTYEADVSPVRRFMTDTGVKVLRPRACYLDIETDSRVPFSRQRKDARVLAWVVIAEDGSRTDAGLLEADTDADERAMLLRLWSVLAPYDQVRGWNLDRFDRPMVEERSKLHRIAVEPRQWLWLDHMELYRRFNAHAAKSGAEKQSMALDAIGKSLGLGGKSDGVDGSMSWHLWSGGPQGRAKLLNYCQRDTDLMRLIENKTGYIELFQTLVEATDVLPDTHGISPMGQVEGFLFRLGKERCMHFRSQFEFGEYDAFAGAFVMQPKWKGYARNVQVADFAGMYPSIITTWNLSPETHRPEIRLVEGGTRPSYLMHVPRKRFPLPPGHCEVPLLGHVFANEPKGILPIAVDALGELRAKWQKLKATLPPGTPEWNAADRKADAYKIARNSFYGVTGSPMSRFFLREVAESTSQGGVWLAKETIAFFEQHGAFVGYGDTDSSMASGLSEEEFGRVVELCNTELYPRLLREKGCARNTIKLEFEKGFDRIVFVAAKKYVGKFSHYKGKRATVDSEPEVKGLEWKRGDAARLTRELQGEVIVLMMGGDDPPGADVFVPVIERWQARILTEPLVCADVKIAKRLSKALSAYTVRTKQDGKPAAEPPHVRVARELKKRGADVGEGTKIEYVVLDADKNMIVPACDWNGECDRHYVWEQMVYPATQRLLAAAYPDFDWNRWAVTRPRRVLYAAKREARKVAATKVQGRLFK